jgi:hypothetical protein
MYHGDHDGQGGEYRGDDDDNCHGDHDHDHNGGTPVGLSLWFEQSEIRDFNEQPHAVDIYEDFPRYIQELDVTAQVTTTTDQGIEPLKNNSEMADLDWSGVQLVDEDWRPGFDGTFTRSRFYRGAKWMERSSTLALVPVDNNNHPVGPALFETAGSDNKWKSSDDTFIRRFDARQVVPGCQAIGDCSNATQYLAQGLAQMRDAMHPEEAVHIPASATKLALYWTEEPGRVRYAKINHKRYADTPYRYGFSTNVEMITPPANGKFYVPGEGFDVRVSFRDGQGNRLHPVGSLPNYQQFIDGIPSGLRQYDSLRQLLTLYYGMKHREGLMEWGFSGPSNKVHQPKHEIGFFDFFGPPTPSATVAEDGFTGIVTLNPSITSIAVQALWSAPVSDTQHFDIPADALPGTYTMTIKGRRDWGGEALNRAGVATFQVGQVAPTTFNPSTGNCQNCHQGQAAFSKILHSLDDRRTCNTCHSKMAFEPDHALDYRIHLIHSRSDRFPADVNNCSTCHLTPPTGPAKGFPGTSPF